MIVKYISGNSRTEFILNQNYGISIKECSPYQTEWTYESVERQYGIDITSFGKDPIELQLTLKYRGTRKQVDENLERMFAECENDIIGKTPGQLWIGGHYLNGYFVQRSTASVSEYYGREQELVFLSPYGFWISQAKKSFVAQSGGSAEDGDLDYNYDYDYDYAPDVGIGRHWYVDHFAPSEFSMVIFGPASDPHININGHAYQVYADVEAGEYIEINSRDNTVVKHRANGSTANLYDMRGKEESVFDPIPGGMNVFSWSGAFGFEITLFLERSEPKW